MSSEQLAGQVIVGRYLGTDPTEVATMLREQHLAGISITNGNVVDEAQVREMTAALTQASLDDGRAYPPVLGVDQEGGYVSHLRGIATEFPAFDAAGAAISADGRVGREVVRQAAYATGLELRDLGFTWVFAPVADVTIGAADPTIGTRSASEDPAIAAKATAAAVRGFDAAGVVSTVKHFPGHGAATSDSHDTLPVLDSTLAEIEAHDLPPFEAAIATHAPAVMLSHLDLTAIAPGVPASLAPEVYDLLRDDLGFEGVAITDSLGMGAVAVELQAGRRRAQRRRRPAADAGRHRRDPPRRHPGDRRGRHLARADRGGGRPGRRAAAVAAAGRRARLPCPPT